MIKIQLKLIVPGDSWQLEIYEKEPGKLMFDILDPEDSQRGGFVEIETDAFFESLKKVFPDRF